MNHNVGVSQSTVGSITCETVNAHTRDVNVLAGSAESLVAGLVLQGSGPNLGIINQEGLDNSEQKTTLKTNELQIDTLCFQETAKTGDIHAIGKKIHMVEILSIT